MSMAESVKDKLKAEQAKAKEGKVKQTSAKTPGSKLAAVIERELISEAAAENIRLKS